MNNRERQALDRYITGNYGEDQLRGEAEFERKLDELLNRREKCIRLAMGFQVERIELELDKLCPEWREFIQDIPTLRGDNFELDTKGEAAAIYKEWLSKARFEQTIKGALAGYNSKIEIKP
jgi:hypothetical protein